VKTPAICHLLAVLVFLTAGNAFAIGDPYGPIDSTALSTLDKPPGPIDPKESLPPNTPFGRYHHQLMLIVGTRWSAMVKADPSVSVGNVTVSLRIAKSGRIIEAKALPGGNADLAKLSIAAIKQCALPRFPMNLHTPSRTVPFSYDSTSSFIKITIKHFGKRRSA